MKGQMKPTFRRLQPNTSWRTIFLIFNASGPLVATALLLLFFSLRSPYFFDLNNFGNIGIDMALLLVAAFAQTFIILSGEIDLSIGATVSLTGIFTAMVLRDSGSIPLALLVGLLVGGFIGLVSGAITVLGRISSFIVTLGIYNIARGLCFTITGNRAVSIFDDTYLNIFANAAPLGLPTPIWIALVSFVFLHLCLTRTTFGKEVYAVGGNVKAASLSGLPTRRIKISIFVLAGIFIALAGFMENARLGSATIEGGSNLQLDSIAAVVIGGTSLSGGRGSLIRTIIGALLIGVLNNGLTLLNVTSFYQSIIKGAIIIIAVLLDRHRT